MADKNDLITFWLDSAGRYHVLPESEVIRLSKIIHEQGPDSRQGKKAVDKLVRHNLKLVPSIVRKAIGGRKKFSFGDDQTADLLQAGVFGLTRAAHKFDPTLGYKFSTYAYMWVRQCVQRTLYKMSSLIHVPETYHRDIYKMDNPQWMKNLRESSKTKYECSVDAYRALGGFCTLHYRDEDGHEMARHDTTLVSEAPQVADSVHDLFELAEIEDEDRMIAYEVYCNDKPVEHLAQELGTTRNAISRRARHTLMKMRVSMSR